jgi:hypothetical protein
MADHFVLPLETLAAVRSRTPLDRTIMRSGLRMNVRMRVQKILSLERRGSAPLEFTDILAHILRI